LGLQASRGKLIAGVSMSVRILVFAGSVRVGAFSGQTADVAQKELAVQGAEVTRISLGDYPMPIVDQNLERESGVPENALKLARQIAAHDGMLIASPEYNSSIPPLLKNAIDWVSRVRKDGERPFKPYAGKVAGLCSSSDGNFAGMRGLYHLRSVLMNCGVEIITPQCSVARAQEAFDEKGDFREERLRTMMTKVCATLIERAAMFSGKRA
jgi:chromate reductase